MLEQSDLAAAQPVGGRTGNTDQPFGAFSGEAGR